MVQGHQVTRKLILSVAASSLGMFSFGYNLSILNAPQMVIQQFYNSSFMEREGRWISRGTANLLIGLSVSFNLLGGTCGAVLVGWWADTFGRKIGMMLNTIPGTVGALLMSLSYFVNSYEMVIIGRYITGFACGIYTGITPMYNAEVAPTHLRGAIGTVSQVAITVGILIAQSISPETVLGSPTLWPLLFGLAGVPMLLQLFLLTICPESPRYLLLIKGDKEGAIEALLQLRGQGDEVIDDEIEQYLKEADKEEEKMSVFQILKTRSLRTPLFLSVVIQLSPAIFGIPVLLNYSTCLFEMVGLNTLDAQYASIAIGGVQFVMAIVGIYLMDRLGRRTLLLTGLSIMLFFNILFTVSYSLSRDERCLVYVAVVFLMIVNLGYSIGPGPIPWFVVAELFNQGPRPAAVSIATLFGWIMSFIIVVVFLPLQEALGSLVLVPLIVLSAFCLAYLIWKLPETKNRTFDEIAALFSQNVEVGYENRKVAASMETSKESMSDLVDMMY